MQNLEAGRFSPEIQKKEKFITQRIVVKIGSDTITGGQETLDIDFMDNIARQVSDLYKSGVKVAIVTSGAVACGKSEVQDYDEDSEDSKREAACIGQLDLMSKWKELLYDKYKVRVSMHVFTEHDIKLAGTRRLLNKIIGYTVPLINANDSVNSFEIKKLAISADNDRLSGFVTEAVGADTLALLTDVPGVKDISKQVREVIYTYEDTRETIVFYEKPGGISTGGMESKHNVALDLAKKGIRAVIGDGRETDILLRVARGENVGTVYLYR